MNAEILLQKNPTDYIDIELQKAEVTEELLMELANRFKSLKVAGPEDKAGLRGVVEARITLKKQRVEIEKIGKKIRESATNFNKAVIKRERELIDIIEPVEQSLRAEEKRIEEEIEAIKREEERKQAQKFQNRVASLAKFNAAADAYELMIMSDEDFASLLLSAEADFAKEEQRKADAERILNEQRIAREESERIERERLEQERQRLAKQKAEQEGRERELQRQEEERKAAAIATAEAIRKEYELFKAEQKAAQDKLYAERKAYEDQRAKEEAEKQKAEREAKERFDRARSIELEAERQEALRPDKEKLQGFINSVGEFCRDNLPEMTTPEGHKGLIAITIILEKAIENIRGEIAKL